MAFARPVQKAPAVRRGPKKHEAGKKLYNNQVLHTSDFVQKYPGKPVRDSMNQSSSPWECLKNPQHALSPQAWAGCLDYTKTEIINRPPVGLSELGGVLIHMNDLLADGVEAKILHPELLHMWNAKWTELNLQAAAETLDQNDFPDAPRASQDLQAAVKAVCELGNFVRQHWSTWSVLLGFGAGLLVDTSWILTMSSLTIPGLYADKIKDVPCTNELLKSNLLREPARGKLLLAFLEAEVHSHHGVRRLKEAVPPQSTFVPLTWDDEDEPVATEVKEPKKVTKLKTMEAAILAQTFPAAKEGKTMPSKKRVREFASAFGQQVETFTDKLNAYGMNHPAAVTDIAGPAFKKHVKKVRKKIETCGLLEP